MKALDEEYAKAMGALNRAVTRFQLTTEMAKTIIAAYTDAADAGTFSGPKFIDANALAKMSVEYADALIAELKRTENP